MSVHKNRLENRLDEIWKLGDRDEVSIKHILYSVGAILAGRKWNTQAAYGDEVGMNQNTEVQLSWDLVETMINDWGLEVFAEVFYSTKFGSCVDYSVDHWYLEE